MFHEYDWLLFYISALNTNERINTLIFSLLYLIWTEYCTTLLHLGVCVYVCMCVRVHTVHEIVAVNKTTQFRKSPSFSFMNFEVEHSCWCPACRLQSRLFPCQKPSNTAQAPVSGGKELAAPGGIEKRSRKCGLERLVFKAKLPGLRQVYLRRYVSSSVKSCVFLWFADTHTHTHTHTHTQWPYRIRLLAHQMSHWSVRHRITFKVFEVIARHHLITLFRALK